MRGHPGVGVRYVAAASRPVPVTRRGRRRVSGSAPDGRRYRWTVRRLGARRPLARGASRAESLTVRAPRGRVGRRAARAACRVAPLHDAVRGAGTRARAGAGRAAGDDVAGAEPARGGRRRLSGRAARRPGASALRAAVRGRRPAAAGSLPDQAGCCGFLRSRAAALRPHHGPGSGVAAGARSLDRYTGVLFAGAPRFVPAPVEQRAARVRAGRRPAGLGRAPGFEWSVRVARPRDRARTGARATSRSAERVRLEREAVPLAVLERPHRLLRAACRAFGPFGPLEESAAAAPRARACWPRPAPARSGRPWSSTATGGGIVARVGRRRLRPRARARRLSPRG